MFDLLCVATMTKPAQVEDGRLSTYYLGARQRQALEAYRRHFEYRSQSLAMRALLDEVAKHFGGEHVSSQRT